GIRLAAEYSDVVVIWGWKPAGWDKSGTDETATVQAVETEVAKKGHNVQVKGGAQNRENQTVTEGDPLRAENERLTVENEQLRAERDSLLASFNQLEAELTQVKAALEASQTVIAKVQEALTALQASADRPDAPTAERTPANRSK